MKLIVVISILSLIQAEENLGVYVFHGVRHYKEILFENLSSNFNERENTLSVDFSTNDLYVDCYNTINPSVFNISSREHKYITDLSSPQCITVDQETHNAFIGTANGIYEYNATTGVKEFIGARNEDVWRIHHYNGVLYYKLYSHSQEIRKLVNGQPVSYHDFGFETRSFVIDSEENIVCITSNGSLFRHKKATKQNVLYEGISGVTSLTTDRYGNVYFSVADGIYEVRRDGVERLLYIDNPKYIAFDGENNLIYYSNKDLKLYRLKPIENPGESTNSCSDRHTHDKKLDVTDSYNSIMCKIDNLAQSIQTLRTKIDKQQSSSRWIRLETENIPVCRSEARARNVVEN